MRQYISNCKSVWVKDPTVHFNLGTSASRDNSFPQTDFKIPSRSSLLSQMPISSRCLQTEADFTYAGFVQALMLRHFRKISIELWEHLPKFPVSWSFFRFRYIVGASLCLLLLVVPCIALHFLIAVSCAFLIFPFGDTLNAEASQRFVICPFQPSNLSKWLGICVPFHARKNIREERKSNLLTFQTMKCVRKAQTIPNSRRRW